MKDSPLLSICLISYNQEEFILDALKGVAMQEVDFEYELLVADDCSTDRTLDVIREYIPVSGIKQVRYLQRDRNLGIGGNWSDALRQTRGRFVAPLEGDDYWTDRNKLALQAAMLLADESLSGSFHNVEERYVDADKHSFLYNRSSTPGLIDTRQLASANMMQTCSLMYRGELVRNSPAWVYEMSMVDWPLNLYCSGYGPFGYMPKVMGVHRLHSESAWSFLSKKDIMNNVLQAYDRMITGFEPSFPETASYLKQARKDFSAGLQTPKPGAARRVVGAMKRYLTGKKH